MIQVTITKMARSGETSSAEGQLRTTKRSRHTSGLLPQLRQSPKLLAVKAHRHSKPGPMFHPVPNPDVTAQPPTTQAHVHKHRVTSFSSNKLYNTLQAVIRAANCKVAQDAPQSPYARDDRHASWSRLTNKPQSRRRRTPHDAFWQQLLKTLSHRKEPNGRLQEARRALNLSAYRHKAPQSCLPLVVQGASLRAKTVSKAEQDSQTDREVFHPDFTVTARTHVKGNKASFMQQVMALGKSPPQFSSRKARITWRPKLTARTESADESLCKTRPHPHYDIKDYSVCKHHAHPYDELRREEDPPMKQSKSGINVLLSVPRPAVFLMF